MKIRVIEDYPPEKEKILEFEADFEIPETWDGADKVHHFSFMHWFMWFANDPPFEIRIECHGEELRDALKAFFDFHADHWPVREADGSELLYGPGDMVWGWNGGSFKVRVFLSPDLAD